MDVLSRSKNAAIVGGIIAFSLLREAFQKVCDKQLWEVRADLDTVDYNVHADTVPADILPNAGHPDLTLIKRSARTTIMLEMTIPFDSNNSFNNAAKRKRHAPLISDLPIKGWNVHYITLRLAQPAWF